MDWTVFFQQAWNGLVNGIGYALFALGLTLIFGVLKVINLSHGEFFMLGAMVAVFLQKLLGINFFVALIPAALLGGALGFICNRVAVRPLIKSPPMSTILSTLALSYILVNISLTLWPYPVTLKTPFTGVINLGGVHITEASLVSFALGGVAVVVLYLFLTKMRKGKEIGATAQNMVGASLVGINVKGIFDLTFVIAAALAAIGGVLVAPLWQAYSTMGQAILLKGFAIVVVGGMGNVMGCLGVAMLVGVGEALFGNYVSMYFKEAALFVVMIVVLLIRPQGIFAEK